jgi:hypothetical protein
MAGFFKTIWAQDKKAVERLKETATKQADKTVGAANALEATIRDMLEAKRQLNESNAHAQKRGN